LDAVLHFLIFFVHANRLFSPRRICYTGQVLAIAHTGSEAIIDAIPLFEIEEVIDMNLLDVADKTKVRGTTHVDEEFDKDSQKKCGDTSQVKFRNSVQIRTVHGGYNSGRKYYIQTRSEAECAQMVEELDRLSKSELERFLAKSRFIKAQELVNKYYTTTTCRSIVAFLIIAVSNMFVLNSC
jgi:hypothetical protein